MEVGKKIHARDLATATKLVDLMYNIVNPRVSDWMFEGNTWASADFKGGHIALQHTLDGIYMFKVLPDDGMGSMVYQHPDVA